MSPGNAWWYRQQLVHHQAGRKDVAAAIAGLAFDLLRGHVVGGPHDHPGLRQARIGHAGDAEIQDAQHSLVVHHHIGGLHVAMNHALVVRVLEACRQLLEELQLAGQGQRNVLLDVFGERGPLTYSMTMKGAPSCSPKS